MLSKYRISVSQGRSKEIQIKQAILHLKGEDIAL